MAAKSEKQAGALVTGMATVSAHKSTQAPLLVPEMRRIKRIHFVGIGGSGMCGIAEVLLNQGYKISGSDKAVSKVTERLGQMGAEVFTGHDRSHVTAADVVVMSTAIDINNPEIAYAKSHRIPVIGRAEMLGELMRYRHSIAVAGSHGKTTTTSLIASILGAAGLDPTFIIGGLLNSTASNGKLGSSRLLVAEADESDASFLRLQPLVVVLTNIDKDHLNNYGGSFEKLKAAFIAFIHNLPFYGLLVACIDDPAVKSVLPLVQRPVITYGFDPDADVCAYELSQNSGVSRFSVRRRQGLDRHNKLDVSLSMPGKHNVLNGLAAIAIATDEGVADEKIISALSDFAGVGRRFEIHGRFKKKHREFLLVDDYGHHPNEVKATIDAVRNGWPEHKLVMVYQPHRYTRTAELFDQFVQVLSQVDQLLLLDVYAAGETEIPGATGMDLYKAIRRDSNMAIEFLSGIDRVVDFLDAHIEGGEFILTQGAGETGKLARTLKTHWQDGCTE